LSVTEGDWIDYWGDPDSGKSHNGGRFPDPLAIHPQIEADKRDFRILACGYDPKEATSTGQFMQKLGIPIVQIHQGFGLSPALKELERMLRAGRWHHGGNPVARWNADSAEVKQDDQERIKLMKPVRNSSGKRVDGIAASGNAIRVHQLQVDEPPTRVQVFL
jgi:phage terminase large subunit-like protein